MKTLGTVLSIVVLLLSAVGSVGAVAPSVCTPGMSFVADVTIPDGTVIGPGATFVKTWELGNTGTCNWTEEYTLKYVVGEVFGVASMADDLGKEVPPGYRLNYAIKMTAPAKPGPYFATWKLVDANGIQVGQDFYVKIVVGAPPKKAVKSYEDVVGYFTLEYPAAWKMESQSPRLVAFDLGNFSGVVLSVEGSKSPIVVGDQAAIDDLVAYVFDQFRQETVKLLDKGTWPYGPSGDYVEVNVKDRVYKNESDVIYLRVPLNDNYYVAVSLDRVSNLITDQEKQMVGDMVASVKLASKVIATPPAATPQAVVAPQVQGGPIHLAGRGQEASASFSLQQGLAIFRIAHVGKSNFAIWLLDDHGEKVELLVNEIGSFAGSKAVGIEKAGKYLLDVNADGNWTVNVEQTEQ